MVNTGLIAFSSTSNSAFSAILWLTLLGAKEYCWLVKFGCISFHSRAIVWHIPSAPCFYRSHNVLRCMYLTVLVGPFFFLVLTCALLNNIQLTTHLNFFVLVKLFPEIFGKATKSVSLLIELSSFFQWCWWWTGNRYPLEYQFWQWQWRLEMYSEP